MKKSLPLRLGRALLLLAVAIPTLCATTMWVFAHFEGRALTWYHALLFVAETASTTGYGELVPFRSPVTVLYSVSLMVVGFLGLFVYLATLAAEWLSSRIQELPPSEAPVGLHGHVIVCGYSSLVDALFEELQRHQQPFVVLDPNPDRVLKLRKRQIAAVLADPTTRQGLSAGRLDQAQALITNMGDSANASILLQAHHLRADIPLVATAEQYGHERFLKYAGAQKVVSPKEVVGRRMARWVLSPIPESLKRLRTGAVPGLGVFHIPIAPHSPLVGQPIREAGLRERFGASVVALWRRGQVILSPDSNEYLLPGSVITVVHSNENKAALQELSGLRRRIQFGNYKADAKEICILAGCGDVGSAILRGLQSSDLDVRVVSLTEPVAAVPWINGDATDEATLRQAGLMEAKTLLVALDDDAKSIFATLMARQLAPDLRIVARASRMDSVAGLYMAGADWVLAVPDVAGAALARTVMADAGWHSGADEIVLEERVAGASLSGRTIGIADIGRQTGCTIVAVRRAGSLTVTPSSEFTLDRGDVIILLGTPEQCQRFDQQFGVSA